MQCVVERQRIFKICGTFPFCPIVKKKAMCRENAMCMEMQYAMRLNAHFHFPLVKMQYVAKNMQCVVKMQYVAKAQCIFKNHTSAAFRI